MIKEGVFTIAIIFFNIIGLAGQHIDSVNIKIDGVESRELLDYYRFEGINYFNLSITGSRVQDQYFVVTSNEFWEGVSVRRDTMVNTKKYGMKIGKDTLDIRVMSKKISSDTIKFQFHFPGFSINKKFKTTSKDTYSLRDITSDGEAVISRNEPFHLLVYSLPYEDPENPGYLYYCELSREGIPPEKWGEEFGVEHYIIFKIHILD